MALSGITLDAGALIAFERGERRAVGLIARALARGEVLAVPAGVVGQVWRDGRRQVVLVRLLGSALCEVVPLDDAAARRAGQLCGATGSSDVIDASVVLCAATRHHRIATGDPVDLARLDPTAEIFTL